MPSLILLFNHTLTNIQATDARQSLGVDQIVSPPEAILRTWAQVPADTEDLNDFLQPVMDWLEATAVTNDFVLIQGEYGATCLAVKQALRLGLIPVYSTTKRQAVEKHLPDGQVKIGHIFSHVRYRKYEP